ncbi:MAG: hypothetical protein WD604_08750 [Balneolaceae bacterium]
MNTISKFRFQQFYARKLLFTLTYSCIALLVFTGCGSTTSANEEETDKQERTFDLVLAADDSKIGTITTELITEEDDAYIDEGFFITLNISASDFEGPFDINMVDSDSHCGTFDVQSGEKAEMPCNYDDFLDDPEGLTVTAEDGQGEDAYPVSG